VAYVPMVRVVVYSVKISQTNNAAVAAKSLLSRR